MLSFASLKRFIFSGLGKNLSNTANYKEKKNRPFGFYFYSSIASLKENKNLEN